MAYKLGSSDLETVVGPPPGPTTSKKDRAKYIEDLTLARLAAIPENVYLSLKSNGTWISPSLIDDTPVSALTLAKRRNARIAANRNRTKKAKKAARR